MVKERLTLLWVRQQRFADPDPVLRLFTLLAEIILESQAVKREAELKNRLEGLDSTTQPHGFRV